MLRNGCKVPLPPTVLEKPPPCSKGQQRQNSPSAWDNNGVILLVAGFKLICLVIWSGCVMYATYAVYLAGQDYPPKHRPVYPMFNVALFRFGRDGGDDEWNLFLRTLITEFGYGYFLYIVISYVLAKKPVNVRMLGSILLTCAFAVRLIGWTSVIYLFQLPVAYCALMNTCRRKSVLWGVTIFGLWLLNFHEIVAPYIMNGGEQLHDAVYWFHVIAAWHFMRCLSFCCDNWDAPQVSLWNLLCYSFYFPIAFTGPVILYSTFEREILQQHTRRGTLKTLFWKLTYLSCIALSCEFILHVLHFRRFTSFYSDILPQLNIWAIGGIIFWLGQFFMFKYMVIYGIGSSIAEYDGLVVPPLPKCPAHIHRYSVIWKDFDRGLYNFLVKYIYVPSIESLERYEFTKGFHPELKKLIASTLTFCFIYVWHGMLPSVLVWALLNFVGISIERMGSFIRRRVNSQLEIHPMVWDFVLEPILTVPLAAMSILNSAVYLGSLEAAKVFANKFYSTCLETYIIPILFCFTNVAVAIRTLPVFLPQLMTCLKSLFKNKSYQSSKYK